MNKKQIIKKILSAVLVCLVISLIISVKLSKDILIQQGAVPKQVYVKDNIDVVQTKKTISITMIIGNASLELQSENGASLYDTLLQAKKYNQITFSGRMYSGIGFFITDIGSLHSTNGKYLFYYINGKQASVGVSSYVPQNGDIINWKLE